MSALPEPDSLAPTRPWVLVIEDGVEYVEFARAFLGHAFEFRYAVSLADALAVLEHSRSACHAFFVDLRFERAPLDALLGDVDAIASELFGGDTARARRWVKDQQGALILGALRERGYPQRAVFVHDFPRQRLANLARLHGDVRAVPRFDARAIEAALRGEST